MLFLNWVELLKEFRGKDWGLKMIKALIDIIEPTPCLIIAQDFSGRAEDLSRYLGRMGFKQVNRPDCDLPESDKVLTWVPEQNGTTYFVLEQADIARSNLKRKVRDREDSACKKICGN